MGVVGVAVLALFLAWRLSLLPGRMSRSRRALVVMFASLAGLAASLAVTEPELGRPLDRMTVIMMIDRSRSIDLVPGADARVAAELRLAEKGMHDDDRIGTVAFAAEALVEDPPRPKSDLAAAATRRARSRRHQPRVGGPARARRAPRRHRVAPRARERRRANARRRSLRGRRRGRRRRSDRRRACSTKKHFPTCASSRVRAPDARRRRRAARSPRRHGEHARRRRRGAREARRRHHQHGQSTRIAAGEDVLRLREKATEPGLHRYDVEVTALDPSKPTDHPRTTPAARSFACAVPRSRSSSKATPAKARRWRERSRRTDFARDERGATGVPADIGALAGYDLVVLSDVRASDLVDDANRRHRELHARSRRRA